MENGKKKILMVLTGGTICSVINGTVKVQGAGTGTVLESAFRSSGSVFGDDVSFECTENYGIFSENMTVEKWNFLLAKLRGSAAIRDTAASRGSYKSLKGKKAEKPENVFDGIIILHGTDTLAYSAALFSVLMRDMGVPVFLVSSNESLEKDSANGKANFITAVECICMGIKPNVYVTYKNGKRMYLHLAARLTQCRNYDDKFYSKGMVNITDITPETAEKYFKKLKTAKRSSADGTLTVDMFAKWQLKNAVLKIEPYTGLDYSRISLAGVKAVLHGTYHSGTVCTETTEKCAEYSGNSILTLLDRCKKIPVYIAPADLSGITYDTVPVILKHKADGVYFVNGFTNEMAYIKLLVANSYPPLKNRVNEFTASEYNGEKVDKITFYP